MVILDGADDPGVGVVELLEADECAGGDDREMAESRRTGRDDMGTVGSRVRVGDSFLTGWMSLGFVRLRASPAAVVSPLVGGVTASRCRGFRSSSEDLLAARGKDDSRFCVTEVERRCA
jgi:hypothetical protein